MIDRFKVRHGGLMRCCIATLDSIMLLHDKLPDEGERTECMYCGAAMVYKNDAWEWFRNRDDDPVPHELNDQALPDGSNESA